MATRTLAALSSAELLHVPRDVTARSRLTELIGSSLVTEFPVNRSSAGALQLTPDEAADLLLSAVSPWERDTWWSVEVRSLLEDAVRRGRPVTGRYLLSRLQTLSLPRQNISGLGEQMTSLSHLTSCSLACNDLTSVCGGDLPRSLRSLQLYGNRLSDLAVLAAGCPPLEHLGLGKIQLTDDHLQELTLLLSSSLSSLRVLDLCDNHVCDLAKVTSLVTSAPNIRSLNLSGNPTFLSSGYYQHWLSGAGRLRLLDGAELTEAVLAALEDQLREPEEPEEITNKQKSKKSGKKKPAKKSARRPAPDLDPARFEPSLNSALIRMTGVIYLPYVPKDQWPGQELCVAFQWGGNRRCLSAVLPTPAQTGGDDPDRTDGLCPLEALLQERSDVTVLETPLEWLCPDLRSLRDAMLHPLLVDVVRREKWTQKKPKKGKNKGSEKEQEKGKNEESDKEQGKEEKGKKKNSGGKEDKNTKKDAGGKERTSAKDKGKGKPDSSGKEQVAEPASAEEDRPPPEFSLGTALLPLRGLLRPSATLLLQGTTSSTGTPATPTDTHWTEAILNIQEDKKQKKAALKKAAKEENGRKAKRMSGSARSGSSRKKEKPPVPVIQCFFAIELYRKPMLESDNDYVAYMPIDDLE